ncbi:MAG: ATP-binding protein [Bacteroidales bacterium]
MTFINSDNTNNSNSNNNSSNGNSHYADFLVVGRRQAWDNRQGTVIWVFEVTHPNYPGLHTVRQYGFQMQGQMPKMIRCRVNISAGGVRLTQDRGWLLDQLYETQCHYPFTITGNGVESAGYAYFWVVDTYGLEHKLYSKNGQLAHLTVGDEVECEVKKINLEKGYLTLSLSCQEPVFTPNMCYDFDVIEKVCMPGTSGDDWYFRLSYEGVTLNAMAQLLAFQVDMAQPQRVTCVVWYVGNQLRVSQDKSNFLSGFYEVKKQYPFQVMKKMMDETTGKEYYKVADAYGFKHRLYENYQAYNLKEGDTVTCTVLNVSEHLELQHYGESSIQGVFVTAEKLFADIKMKEYVDAFFHDLRDEELGSELRHAFEMYDGMQNLWIFSYLNAFRHYFCGDLERMRIITSICIGIDNWILGSGFLLSFSPERKVEIIVKTESELLKNKAQEKALMLIKEDKQAEYIADKIMQLGQSGYIQDENIRVLKKLLTLSPEFLQSGLNEVCRIFSLLVRHGMIDEYDTASFISILERRIREERSLLDFECHFGKSDTNVDVRMRNIIVLLGIQLLLMKEGMMEYPWQMVLKLSMFYRYLCYLTKEKCFFELAVRALLYDSRVKPTIEFTWEMVRQLECDTILKVQSAIKASSTDYSFSYQLKPGKACLKGEAGMFHLFTDYQNRYLPEKQLQKFYKDLFCLSTQKSDVAFPANADIEALHHFWKDGMKEGAILYGELKVGEVRKVRFVNFNQRNQTQSFLELLEGEHKGKRGVLYMSDFYPDVSSFEGIFEKGDTFEVCVKEVFADGRFTFSLCKPIALEGAPGVAELRHFVETHLLEEFDFAGEPESLEQDENEKKRVRVLLTELIYILDYLIAEATNQTEKFNLMNLAYLAASALGNKASLYFAGQINYLLAIYRFTQGSDLELPEIDPESLKGFPALQHRGNVLDVLRKLGYPEENDELYAMSKESLDEGMRKLAKAIMAYNLLSETPEAASFLDGIRRLIVEHFLDSKFESGHSEMIESFDEAIDKPLSEDVEAMLNMGSEGQYKEFKTSVVYSSQTHQADEETQMDVIMRTIAGFLNSKGGVLYLGVKDNGDIAGLKADYEYLNENSDGYERFVRRNIVKYFNKDVNGTISFEFHTTSQGLVYCVVTIPEYVMPVAYRANFYQRQGNETRILKGDDVTMFMRRKLAGGVTGQPEMPTERTDHYADLKIVRNHVQQVSAAEGRVLAYWNLLIDGCYVMSEGKYVGANVRQSVAITERDRLKGYLLQCYGNGCVNKVPVRELLAKSKGYFYKNGINRDAELLLACVVPDEVKILIQTKRSGDEFVKIYDSANVSRHQLLHLKGNQIVGSDFDGVIRYGIIPGTCDLGGNPFEYASPQGLGKVVSDELLGMLGNLPYCAVSSQEYFS